MLGAVYLALLPLLSYLSGNRDSIVALFVVCLTILFDLMVTDVFKVTLNDFFLFRALVDLTLLVLISKLSLLPIKRYLVCLFVFTSTLINVYLCFELDNVWVYRKWETINLILCELIFLTLIISDRSWLMFARIKLYVYGALAAVGLFLFGWVKYLSAKNESLENELKTEKQNTVVKDTVAQKEKDIQKDLQEVKQESEKVHEQNKKDAISRKRPSGSFLDGRM